jgi:phosphoglycolate phosphatase
MIKNIFFDLDGTITDSAEGIIGTVKFMLSELGIAIPEEDLSWVIGPPFEESVAKLIGDSDPKKVSHAVGIYRAKFVKEGLYQNKLYAGIEEVLKELAEKYTLFIATSKPTPQAKTVAKHFKIDRFFKEIYGSGEHGEMPEKDRILGLALEEQKLKSKECLMIGDRHHDVEGAKAHGIVSISVSYGYGDLQEFSEASQVVNSPAEIPASINFVLK